MNFGNDLEPPCSPGAPASSASRMSPPQPGTASPEQRPEPVNRLSLVKQEHGRGEVRQKALAQNRIVEATKRERGATRQPRAPASTPVRPWPLPGRRCARRERPATDRHCGARAGATVRAAREPEASWRPWAAPGPRQGDHTRVGGSSSGWPAPPDVARQFMSFNTSRCRTCRFASTPSSSCGDARVVLGRGVQRAAVWRLGHCVSGNSGHPGPANAPYPSFSLGQPFPPSPTRARRLSSY